MKVLLVDDDDFMRQIIVACLENKIQAEVIEATSGNDAIECLRRQDDIDLVISDYKMANGSGGDVFRFIHTNKLSVPFVLCSSERPETLSEFQDHELAGYVAKPDVIQPLLRLMTSLKASLDSGAKSEAAADGKDAVQNPAKNEAYCRIRLRTLKKINLLACDFYLKVSDDEYVTIMRKGADIKEKDIEKYSLKGIEHAYIHREDFDAFLEDYLRNIAGIAKIDQYLSRPADLTGLAGEISNEDIASDLQAISEAMQRLGTDKLSVHESQEIAEHSLETIHKAYQKFGVTPETQALTKASVGLAVKTINNIPKLSALFKEVCVDKESYIPSHSVLLAHVSCMVASLMAWTSDLTRFKLSMAAFLHDLRLNDNKLAQIQSLDDPRAKDLGELEIKKIRRHPERGAKMVQEFHEIPPDVDTIILQHHERPDGNGFPYRIDASRISPLATVFIISHDLINYTLDNGLRELDITGFLSEYQESYQDAYFRKVARKLAELT